MFNYLGLSVLVMFTWRCSLPAGHLGIAVPDIYVACKRFEELGVKFVKKVDDGEFIGRHPAPFNNC